jgi:hypothetical protein
MAHRSFGWYKGSVKNSELRISRYVTTADVAAESVRRGDPLGSDAVRLAARTGRLVATAVTVRGVRLFAPADVEAFFVERARRRGGTS